MLNSDTKYFQQKLMYWHLHHNKRVLPWKEEKDVYRIWLSEIILQQTRAEQGWKYYERFVQQFPTVQQLAAAPLEEVYKLWEGLGYYTRCRNLHATACYIVEELNGRFPATYEGLLKLKGVGPYTAAAIASFGFNLPHAVVDGNVFRVLSRFFGKEEPIDSTKGKKLFESVANACLDSDAPALYNQAIMDFGATVCKPEQPLCTSCIFKRKCVALKQNLVQQLPVKEKQVKQRQRWFVFYVLNYRNKFAVVQRTQKDVWQHLYQFPLVEFESEKQWKLFLKNEKVTEQAPFLKTSSFQYKGQSKPVVQKLSHQTIHAVAVMGILNAALKNLNGLEWYSKTELTKLPFPQIIHQLFKGHLPDAF
jgi:A/G-specific adenine glycosylase